MPHFGGTSLSSTEAPAGLPPHLRDDREKFIVTSEHFIAAGKLNEELTNSGKADAKKESEMLKHISSGLAAAADVDDELLDWIHPGMAKPFREQWIRGQQEYLDGFRTGSATRQRHGNELMGAWYAGFWAANGAGVYDKILAE